jgi:hypothetical protein
MNSRVLLSKFPSFAKPFYETNIHKKVDESYDIAVAVPVGKRAFLWFTYIVNQKIVCIIEVGRNQQLQDNIHILSWDYPESFCLGTLLSGYLLDGEEDTPHSHCKYFIADDIFQLKGFVFGDPFPVPLARKYDAYVDFFTAISNDRIHGNYSIHNIVMWNYPKSFEIPEKWKSTIAYPVKHVQLRSSHTIIPHGNYILSKNPWSNGTGPMIIPDEQPNIGEIEIDAKSYSSSVWNGGKQTKKYVPEWNICYHKPIHHKITLFWVMADIDYDVYYLYIRPDVLFQYAFIPTYKTSILMNSLFRNIPENACLDKIEESEDEEDFENIQETKYVDLEKKLLMECHFDPKFRRWIPLRPIYENQQELSEYVPTVEEFVYTTNTRNHASNNHHHRYNHHHNKSSTIVYNNVQRQFSKPTRYVSQQTDRRKENEKYPKKATNWQTNQKQWKDKKEYQQKNY